MRGRVGQGQEATSVLGGQRTKQHIPRLVMVCTAARGGSMRSKEILLKAAKEESTTSPQKSLSQLSLQGSTCSKALSWLEARA